LLSHRRYRCNTGALAVIIFHNPTKTYIWSWALGTVATVVMGVARPPERMWLLGGSWSPKRRWSPDVVVARGGGCRRVTGGRSRRWSPARVGFHRREGEDGSPDGGRGRRRGRRSRSGRGRGGRRGRGRGIAIITILLWKRIRKFGETTSTRVTCGAKRHEWWRHCQSCIQ
jgi:hypothetical protein